MECRARSRRGRACRAGVGAAARLLFLRAARGLSRGRQASQRNDKSCDASGDVSRASCPDNKAQRRRSAKRAAQRKHELMDRESARLRIAWAWAEPRSDTACDAPASARMPARDRRSISAAAQAASTGRDSAEASSITAGFGAIRSCFAVVTTLARRRRRRLGRTAPQSRLSATTIGRLEIDGDDVRLAQRLESVLRDRPRIDEAAETARQRRFRQQRRARARRMRASCRASRLTRNPGARVRLTKRVCLARRDATTCTRLADFRLAAGAVSGASAAAAAAADARSHFLMKRSSQALTGAVRKASDATATAPAAVIRTLIIAFPCGSASGAPMGTWRHGITVTRLRQACRNSQCAAYPEPPLACHRCCCPIVPRRVTDGA